MEPKIFGKMVRKQIIAVLQSCLVFENKQDKNRVFLDDGPATLWSYHTMLTLRVCWL